MAAVVQELARPGESRAPLQLAPRRLRVGLYADSPLQPRWLLEAFARVMDADYAALAAVAVAAGPPGAPRATFLQRAYQRFDRRLYGSDLSEPRDLALLGLPVGEGAAHLESRELDVVFALGAVDDAALDGIARCGVWRFCADGESEVLRGDALSVSGLKVRLAAGAVPRLAYRSWSRTYPLSVARNRRQMLEKTIEFPARALRELHRSGREWLEQCEAFPDKDGDRIHSLLPLGKRLLQRGVQKALSTDQWCLAFRFGGRGVTADLRGFTRIEPPDGATWADPFAVEKNGRYYVFFEELADPAGKGRIAMIELDAQGRHSAPRVVLERDWHLSYPFLFEHEGALYMVPESAQNRRVDAWRCVEFPTRWRLERVLLDGVRLVDSTLARSGDRWWLLANGAAGESRVFDDELHVFHAADPLGLGSGGWRPHRRNPVKSDVRSARPAGAMFWRNGALHRPAQVDAPLYGSGLSINRLLRLTPDEFAEREVERLLPPPASGLLGLHTLNRAGDLTVVDAFRRKGRFQ
jgi:hypothetical protein